MFCYSSCFCYIIYVNGYLQIGVLDESLSEIQGKSYSDEIDDPNAIDAIPVEYKWWCTRAEVLGAKKQQLSLPIIDRTIKMINISCKEAEDKKMAAEFADKFARLCQSLEEAEDNIKFLSGIKRQVDHCTKTEDLDTIRATIPKMLKCLRSAWTLSKHYNTDENIISLLERITSIFTTRVRSLVRLSELSDAARARQAAARSVELLDEWEGAFHATRLAIERSGREARWEFGVQELFRAAHHIRAVCVDVMFVSRALRSLSACFSQELSDATRSRARLKEANATIADLTKSFASLPYDVFSDSSAHHWQNQLSWFRRESRFLEVTSVGILDDVFETLVSSKAAVSALTSMLRQGESNAEIWKVVVANFPKVVRQFIAEVEEQTESFLEHNTNPPIPDDLPPISGSISWARGIMARLEETKEMLSSVLGQIDGCPDRALWAKAVALYEGFRGELADYSRRQYHEWCERVSGILAQNLTRPLLTVSDGGAKDGLFRYSVNFTSDLSDTLAEVRHLETLGFEVPEVARNMSVQKTKLTGIATALESMLARYHECVDSLEGAEVALMREEVGRVTQAFSAGHRRLTWNNQAIQESCLDVGTTCISVLDYKIKQVHMVKADVAAAIEHVRHGCLIKSVKLYLDLWQPIHFLFFQDQLDEDFGFLVVPKVPLKAEKLSQ